MGKKKQQEPQLGRAHVLHGSAEPGYCSVGALGDTLPAQLSFRILSVVTCGRRLLSSEVIDTGCLFFLFINRSVANAALGSQGSSLQRMLRVSWMCKQLLHAHPHVSNQKKTLGLLSVGLVKGFGMVGWDELNGCDPHHTARGCRVRQGMRRLGQRFGSLRVLGGKQQPRKSSSCTSMLLSGG